MDPRDAKKPPWQLALLGGDGVVQPGNSENLGDQLVQNPLDPAAPILTRILKATLIQGECMDQFAQQLTIVLAANRVAQGTPEQAHETARMFARITFGVGGTQAEMDVDYIDGCMFNVPASYLRVVAHIDLDPGEDPAPGTIPETQAQAFIGYYPHGGAVRAQRTQRLGLVADAATSAIFPIPDFARVGRLIGSDPTAPVSSGAVSLFADAAAAVPVGVFTAVDLLFLGGFPLTNGARYYSYTNLSGSPLTVRLIWNLAA